jgi:hypothetical protein
VFLCLHFLIDFSAIVRTEKGVLASGKPGRPPILTRLQKNQLTATIHQHDMPLQSNTSKKFDSAVIKKIKDDRDLSRLNAHVTIPRLSRSSSRKLRKEIVPDMVKSEQHPSSSPNGDKQSHYMRFYRNSSTNYTS